MVIFLPCSVRVCFINMSQSCHFLNVSQSYRFINIFQPYHFINISQSCRFINIFQPYHFINISQSCRFLNVFQSYHVIKISQSYRLIHTPQSHRSVNISHISSIYHVQNHETRVIIQTSNLNQTDSKTTYLVCVSKRSPYTRVQLDSVSGCCSKYHQKLFPIRTSISFSLITHISSLNKHELWK